MIDTFPNIIAFSVMGALLILGTVLRTKLSMLRYALVPASLIGGIIGFILFSAFDIPAVKDMNFAKITFHCFTLSFISLCLTQGEKPKKGEPGIGQGTAWLSTIWVSSLMIQAFIGLSVILLYNLLASSDVSTFLGIIVTHGYTQGPGQALAMGSIWEQNFGVADAISVGLIYASLGFIASFAIGVPVARWAVKKGLNANKAAVIDAEFSRGLYDTTTTVSTGRQVTHPSNVDSLAFHIAIIGVVYLITHIWLVFLQNLVGDAQPYGVPIGITVSHNLFFAHGLIIAVIVRKLLNKMGWGHLIDDDTQKRITGTSIDFMIIGTLLSIQIVTLLNLLVPILLVSVLATLATAFLCFGLGRYLANLSLERALTSFGTCTGSAGSALLLLRIVDPDFSTSISKELAFFNVAVTLGTFHIWGVAAPLLPSLNPYLAFSAYFGTLAVAGIIFMQLKIRKPATQGILQT